MTSIFRSIVKSENDHTNLLRNIMERHPKFLANLLNIGSRPTTVSDAAAMDISTQHIFYGENGREIPDIVISGKSWRCLIEAKVDPWLDLTDNQKNGYADCFSPEEENLLLFLLPKGYKHASSIDKLERHLPLKVKTLHWNEIIDLLSGMSASLDDDVLSETVNFWKERFEMEELTAEERGLLAEWPDEKYRAIRKLERVINQTGSLFSDRGYKAEFDKSQFDEYGFYIKNSKFYVLWVGIMLGSTAPLTFGFHSNKPHWQRPKQFPEGGQGSGTFRYWPIDRTAWGDPELVYQSVESFLRKYWQISAA